MRSYYLKCSLVSSFVCKCIETVNPQKRESKGNGIANQTAASLSESVTTSNFFKYGDFFS